VLFTLAGVPIEASAARELPPGTSPVAAVCDAVPAVLVASEGGSVPYERVYLAVRDYVWEHWRFQVSPAVVRDVLRASGLSLSFSAEGPVTVHDVRLAGLEL
jgi:hypothetical protein